MVSQTSEHIHSVFGDAPNLKITGAISSSNFISIILNLLFPMETHLHEILTNSSFQSFANSGYFYQNPSEEEFYSKN